MRKWFLAAALLLTSCTPSVRTSSSNEQNFVVYVSEDPITGEDTSVAYVSENSPAPDRKASLIWGCQDTVIRVAVYPDESLGVSKARVQYRIDDFDAVTDKGWQVTNAAIFFPSIKGLDFTALTLGLQAKRLAFRVTDADDNSHTYLFDLIGLRSALEQLPCIKPLFE